MNPTRADLGEKSLPQHSPSFRLTPESSQGGMREKTGPGFPAYAEARPLRLRAGRRGGDAFSEPLLRRPGHDRHDADRVRRRAFDDLRADGEIDDRVPFHVWHPVDARRLEEDAGLLAEGFFLLGQRGEVGGDRPELPAGNGEVRRVFIETERLPPSALSGLRDEAGHARYFRIVEVTHANLIAGRSESEGRADASKIVGARKARCGEKQHRR